MEIVVADFINQVKEQKMATALLTASASQVAALNTPDLLKTAFMRFDELVATHPVVQVTQLLDYGLANGEKTEVKVMFESGIINLPYHNIERVANFFNDETQSVPLNLNVTVVSDVMQSGLHIDEIATVAEARKNPEATLLSVSAKVAAQLAIIKQRAAEAVQAADEKSSENPAK